LVELVAVDPLLQVVDVLVDLVKLVMVVVVVMVWQGSRST
jgi:hypothetical protein